MPYNRIEPKWKKIFSSLKKKAASDSGDGAQLEKSQDVWDILNDKYQASEFSRSETKTTSKDILLKILKKPSEPGEELSEEDFMEKVKAMNLDDRGQQEFLLDMDSIMNSLRVEKKPPSSYSREEIAAWRKETPKALEGEDVDVWDKLVMMDGVVREVYPKAEIPDDTAIDIERERQLEGDEAEEVKIERNVSDKGKFGDEWRALKYWHERYDSGVMEIARSLGKKVEEVTEEDIDEKNSKIYDYNERQMQAFKSKLAEHDKKEKEWKAAGESGDAPIGPVEPNKIELLTPPPPLGSESPGSFIGPKEELTTPAERQQPSPDFSAPMLESQKDVVKRIREQRKETGKKEKKRDRRPKEISKPITFHEPKHDFSLPSRVNRGDTPEEDILSEEGLLDVYEINLTHGKKGVDTIKLEPIPDFKPESLVSDKDETDSQAEEREKAESRETLKQTEFIEREIDRAIGITMPKLFGKILSEDVVIDGTVLKKKDEVVTDGDVRDLYENGVDSVKIEGISGGRNAYDHWTSVLRNKELADDITQGGETFPAGLNFSSEEGKSALQRMIEYGVGKVTLVNPKKRRWEDASKSEQEAADTTNPDIDIPLMGTKSPAPDHRTEDEKLQDRMKGIADEAAEDASEYEINQIEGPDEPEEDNDLGVIKTTPEIIGDVDDSSDVELEVDRAIQDAGESAQDAEVNTESPVVQKKVEKSREHLDRDIEQGIPKNRPKKKKSSMNPRMISIMASLMTYATDENIVTDSDESPEPDDELVKRREGFNPDDFERVPFRDKWETEYAKQKGSLGRQLTREEKRGLAESIQGWYKEIQNSYAYHEDSSNADWAVGQMDEAQQAISNFSIPDSDVGEAGEDYRSKSKAKIDLLRDELLDAKVDNAPFIDVWKKSLMQFEQSFSPPRAATNKEKKKLAEGIKTDFGLRHKILDDLGKENATAWAQEQIDQADRIISVNSGPETSLEETVGDVDFQEDLKVEPFYSSYKEKLKEWEAADEATRGPKPEYRVKDTDRDFRETEGLKEKLLNENPEFASFENTINKAISRVDELIGSRPVADSSVEISDEDKDESDRKRFIGIATAKHPGIFSPGTEEEKKDAAANPGKYFFVPGRGDEDSRAEKYEEYQDLLAAYELKKVLLGKEPPPQEYMAHEEIAYGEFEDVSKTDTSTLDDWNRIRELFPDVFPGHEELLKEKEDEHQKYEKEELESSEIRQWYEGAADKQKSDREERGASKKILSLSEKNNNYLSESEGVSPEDLKDRMSGISSVQDLANFWSENSSFESQNVSALDKVLEKSFEDTFKAHGGNPDLAKENYIPRQGDDRFFKDYARELREAVGGSVEKSASEMADELVDGKEISDRLDEFVSDSVKSLEKPRGQEILKEMAVSISKEFSDSIYKVLTGGDTSILGISIPSDLDGVYKDVQSKLDERVRSDKDLLKGLTLPDDSYRKAIEESIDSLSKIDFSLPDSVIKELSANSLIKSVLNSLSGKVKKALLPSVDMSDDDTLPPENYVESLPESKTKTQDAIDDKNKAIEQQSPSESSSYGKPGSKQLPIVFRKNFDSLSESDKDDIWDKWNFGLTNKDRRVIQGLQEQKTSSKEWRNRNPNWNWIDAVRDRAVTPVSEQKGLDTGENTLMEHFREDMTDEELKDSLKTLREKSEEGAGESLRDKSKEERFERLRTTTPKKDFSASDVALGVDRILEELGGPASSAKDSIRKMIERNKQFESGSQTPPRPPESEEESEPDPTATKKFKENLKKKKVEVGDIEEAPKEVVKPLGPKSRKEGESEKDYKARMREMKIKEKDSRTDWAEKLREHKKYEKEFKENKTEESILDMSRTKVKSYLLKKLGY